MDLIPIVIIAFGAGGAILSLYLRFTVVSPLLATEDGKDVVGTALSIQQILNRIFVYFTVLHVIIALVGVRFLMAS